MYNSKILFIVLIFLTIYIFGKRIEKFTITRPSKCFDCEKEIIKKEGVLSVWKALPTKCFDCEKQNGIKPYNTGPNKCFDCEYFKNNKTKNKSWFEKLFLA